MIQLKLLKWDASAELLHNIIKKWEPFSSRLCAVRNAANPNNTIRSEAVEDSLKLWILLVIFILLCCLAHADSDSHRHASLHILTVTPIGSSANAGSGMELQRKLPYTIIWS